MLNSAKSMRKGNLIFIKNVSLKMIYRKKMSVIIDKGAHCEWQNVIHILVQREG
jgi:hypothetical protein